MKIFKQIIRKVAIANSVHSVKDVLKDFIERSDEAIEDFSGKLEDLILAQAVRVLRQKKTCITPEAIEESGNLAELVKSLEEVKNDKDVLCRAGNTRK